MKQLLLQSGKARLFEVDPPLIGDREILVQVHYSFISSGTEFATMQASGKNICQRFFSNIAHNTAKVAGAIQEHGVSGTISLIQGALSQVVPVGYSCSGVVVACGVRVTKFRIGDLVACGGAGSAYHAQQVAVPENLAVTLKHSQSLKAASITTIAAIALQGIRRAHIQLGEHVCIIGLGLLGQLLVQLAKQSGAIVYAVDVQDARLALAKEYGADYVFNGLTEDWRNSLAFATGHYGVDTTIVAAASNTGQLLNDAMVVTRRKGKVVLVGDVRLDFDREHFYNKEVDLLISCSYGPGRYDQQYEREGHDYPYPYVRWTENRNMALCAQLIEEKKLFIEPLMQHEFLFEQAEEAYRHLAQQQSLGIVLCYKPKLFINQPLTNTKQLVRVVPSSMVNVAVVGVGGFCKVKLLPILASLRQIKLYAVVDTMSAQAVSIARQYNIAHSYTSYDRVIHDPDVHVVIVTTPHAFHAQQIIAALEQGKAVFAEKPLAISKDQLMLISSHLKEHPSALLAVDFNRSWSPMMLHIKKIIRQRSTPIMINYRMNLGHLSLDHWVQSDVHGGRIIGEACHIFELFLFLTDASPRSVSVTPLAPQEGIKNTDNVIVTLAMDDGSVCSLTFTSVGSSRMRKEYMEIFFDGKSLIMEDYLSLKGYGTMIGDHLELQHQDKGHEALLRTFFKQVQQHDAVPPVTYERLIKATEISLIVDDLVWQGGGMYQY